MSYFIIIVAFLVVMNVAGFLSMGLDKSKAKHHQNRISEMTLMLIAALGGAAGSWLGMEVFRHKTQHAKFSVGVPVIFAIQIVILLFLNNKFNFLS